MDTLLRFTQADAAVASAAAGKNIVPERYT